MKKKDKDQAQRINPFELINKVDELPPELKSEVLATINLVQLVTDVGQLFSVDMAATASKLIDPGAGSSQPKQ